jgi:magnesium transporter
VAAHLVDGEGPAETADRAAIEARLRDRTFFWLDLHEPAEEDFALLREVFEFHPLALEDSEHFGQRAKLDEYDDFVFLVVYGAVEDEDDLVEVHCFYSERFLVTVRRDDCPAFELVRERHAKRHRIGADPVLLLYQVIDGLVDSFFPILAGLDDRIDELEDGIFGGPTDEQLQEIFQLKRRLMTMRKAVAPQRDLFASLVVGVAALPGMTPEAERYFRDVYDHLIRIADLIDSYRDLTSGTMDIYLSTVSNRLNGVMKQLAVIATIFLPLSFVTGFFGQNFGAMVDRIGGLPAFVGLGVGIQLASLLALLVYFKRRGWF